MIRSAYLRIYLPAERAGSLRPHQPRPVRAVVRSSDHFVWSEPTGDDALEVQWEGVTYRCPRFPRLRMLEGVVAFDKAYPGGTLVPDIAVRHAADELAAMRARSPEVRSYILTSPWHVPLRWFAAFRPDQKELYVRPGGKTAVRYRTTVRAGLARVSWAVAVLRESGFDEAIIEQVVDLERWLSEFSGDAMLELDYASAADWFDEVELALDDSAEDVEASLRALEQSSYEEAGLHYAQVASRWAVAQAMSYAN